MHHSGDVTIIRTGEGHEGLGQVGTVLVCQLEVALRNLVHRIRCDLNRPLHNLLSRVNPGLCPLHLQQLLGHLRGIHKLNEVRSENLHTGDSRALFQEFAHFHGNDVTVFEESDLALISGLVLEFGAHSAHHLEHLVLHEAVCVLNTVQISNWVDNHIADHCAHVQW